VPIALAAPASAALRIYRGASARPSGPEAEARPQARPGRRGERRQLHADLPGCRDRCVLCFWDRYVW
jgi:hypothetical protein